jgi:hypothetical protein
MRNTELKILEPPNAVQVINPLKTKRICFI